MKKSIIYLGIITVAFSNLALALNNGIRYQKAPTTAIVNVSQTGAGECSNKVDDAALLELDTILRKQYEKSIPEIITENNSIIDNVFEEPAYIDYIVTSNTITIDNKQFVSNEKTIDEIIEENNQIIDTNFVPEFVAINVVKTIDEIIEEDNKIIESTLSTEIRVLDYDKINSKIANSFNNKVITGIN